MAAKQSRRAAREQAFQTLFVSLFQQEESDNLLEMVRTMLEKPSDPYCDKLVTGVLKCQEVLDTIFEPYLTANWKKERLSKVSLVLLRLGVYEIYFVPEVPASVAINEAVELAKKYADPKEASFINGVFGSVFRARQSEIANDDACSDADTSGANPAGGASCPGDEAGETEQ